MFSFYTLQLFHIPHTLRSINIVSYCCIVKCTCSFDVDVPFLYFCFSYSIFVEAIKAYHKVVLILRNIVLRRLSCLWITYFQQSYYEIVPNVLTTTVIKWYLSLINFCSFKACRNDTIIISSILLISHFLACKCRLSLNFSIE